ncbi:phage tail tape measure protein [Achromobacter xylosoxidans]|uniref:phage tail tape measure protein n=1 Tax=Alcaligenes xylosoxydans xylosoxydans TaxID=85698 RepID=UPI0012A8EA8E|nr:phage tail tape measure protein [Achromobacter xylosoxidans]CUR79994.1 phage tail tape measure protein, TP901 family, core region [Achromobacter xylosoxidans]
MDKALQLRVIAALQDKLSGPLRKIKSTAGASAQGVADLRGKLKQLTAAQREVGQFRELTRGLQTTRAELAAAQQRVAALAQQMQGATNPTRAMTREFNQAVRAAQQLKERHGQQSVELQRLRDNLTRAGLSTSNLARDERDLRQKIDNTSQALDRQTRKLQAAAAHHQKLATAKEKYGNGKAAVGAMAGAGAAGLASGGAALYAESRFIRPGVEFDAKMSKVQALARIEKDSAEMQALRKQARDLGAKTMFSATQAADAQGFLAMAGFTPKAIQDAMPGMLSLAKAGDTDLAQTADIGSNILTGFKLPAEQMNRVGDVLTGAFTRSNTSLYMLGETMKYVAPVAAGVGQDIETVAAMAGKLGDAGIQGSMGGTALRAVIGRLAAPPKAAADALDALNIKTKDANGNLRQLPDILAELHQKTAKMGNAERSGFFKHIAGEEAFSGLQVLVEQAGTGELQKFIAILKKAAGEADKTAGTMADNLTGDLDELKSAWEDVGIQTEELHDKTLRRLTKGLAGVVSAVGEWMKANPQIARALTATAAVIAGLVAAFGALTLALAAVLGPFIVVRYGLSMLGIQGGSLIGVLFNLAKGGFGLLGSAIVSVGKLLLGNPIVLAVAAIAGAAYLIYQYWTPIKAFFSGLWAQVTAAFDSAMAWLGQLLAALNPIPILSAAWNGLTTFFSDIWESVKVAFDGGLAGIGALLVNWSPLGLLYQAITGALGTLGLELPGNFTQFGSMLIQGLINGISSMAGALKESISNIGTGIVGWFKEKLGIHSPSRVFAQMGGFVSEGAAVGIEAGQPAAVKAAQALAASVAIGGAMLPASGALAASGGLLAAPAGMVTDAGALARIDHRPAMAASAAGGRSITIQGDTISIHISGAGAGAQDIARAVEDALRRRDADKAARLRSAYYDNE